jgi:hypothetical protein
MRNINATLIFFLIIFFNGLSIAHEIYLKNGRIITTDSIVEESDFITYYRYRSAIKISKESVLKIQYDETSIGKKKIRSNGMFRTSFDDYSSGNRNLIMDPGFRQIYEIGQKANFVLEYIEDQYVKDLFIYQNYKGLTKCIKDTYPELGLPSNVKLDRRIICGPPMKLAESKLNEFIESEESRIGTMAEMVASNAENLFYR